MANESGYEIKHLEGMEALVKVRNMLKHFRSTMMVTTADADLHSRPMGLQGNSEAFEGRLWFFTDKDCDKVKEIQNNPAVSLIFQSDADSAYMHLFGKAEVVQNRAKMEELYTPILKTWFPAGLDDPQMTLILFDTHQGNFWDSPGGMLQVWAAYTKSVLTGTRGQGAEMGEVKL